MTQPRLELHPDAVDEAAEARRWYSAIDVDLGVAFADELDTAIDRIRSAPQRWPAHLHGTRCVLLHRFPYVVVYRQVEGAITIIAISHGKRRPGYWKTRTIPRE